MEWTQWTCSQDSVDLLAEIPYSLNGFENDLKDEAVTRWLQLQDVTRWDEKKKLLSLIEPDAKNRNLAAHQKDEEGNSRPQDLLTEGDPGSDSGH